MGSMAFQPWSDMPSRAEAGKQGSALCSAEGPGQCHSLHRCLQPGTDPALGDCGGFAWWKQATNSWMLIIPHCLLPSFYLCRIFHSLKTTKRSYFPSVSETPSFFPDFPFHAVWILLRSLYTKAEYWLYDALRDLKGCCHNVTKLWGHFISTRSSLEDCV